MRGGVKIYRGSAAGARAYLEAERSRADDYYLTEGTGYGRRYRADAAGAVERLPDLAGVAYEAWVSGVDPDTGVARGKVRQDEHAVRFAEVVVNGPKSWSLAAELHPDIAVAYEAAQDRGAVEIVRWMGQNATTRVGPRGGQIATPVECIEAVTVRHYTSRAGDPHRHLHVQINARVDAAGKWRGIDTVAVRDSIAAVHGIGHAAVVADPEFRQVLAGHGFTLDGDGEITQLAAYVAPFSKRAEQIAGQLDSYEAEWRTVNPGRVPGPALRRGWDARAWQEHRPGKGHAETAAQARGRWVEELRGLGYRDPARPVVVGSVPVGQLDRAAAAGEVLSRLAAVRSAWNHPDVRGEAEQLIARAGIVADPAIRSELAEDITARAVAGCVPLLEGDGVPSHIRAWTSPAVVAVEEDITGRFAVRGAHSGHDASVEQITRAAVAAGAELDPAQAEAVAALAGDHALVLVAGAAGAGKTTTLAVAKAGLEDAGHQVLVVTPTLKAARTARRETGARAGSAAWLAYQHGWRWDESGTWTRLHPGEVDPATGKVYRGPAEDAQLRPGDLLVVDEAGMADQDTARALLHVVDEQRVRLALVGDPHQLAAIGRGGVLDLARRWADRAVTLDVIHRFTREVEIAPGITGTVPDPEYADLSLRMRTGQDPGAVFDQLQARGQVRRYPDVTALRHAVATEAARARSGGRPVSIAVDTREQARELNTATREQLVQAGMVDDTTAATTAAGERIGAGDLVATRRNDHDTGVANRDTFTVTAVHADGSLTVTGPTGDRNLSAGYTAEHVELAYASTVHGIQGDTTSAGHLVLGEHTSAGAAYVGMTRGRAANTLHVVAGDLTDARQQWIDAAGRDRADLGIDAARAAAQRAAAPYTTTLSHPAGDARLAQILDELRHAWTQRARADEQLQRLEPRLAAAQDDATRREQAERVLAPLREQMHTTRAAADAAERHAAGARAPLDQHAQAVQASLRADWDSDRPAAAQAARTVNAGTGRFGRGRGRVTDAQRLLTEWADKWRPVQPELTDAAAAARLADRHPAGDRIDNAIHDYAQRRAADAMPHHIQVIRDAEHTRQTARAAERAYLETAGPIRRQQALQHARTGYRDLAEDLPQLTRQATTARDRLTAAEQRIHQLTADPALGARPDAQTVLAAAHRSWNLQDTHTQAQALKRAAARHAEQAAQQHTNDGTTRYGPSYPPAAGRRGPRLGR